MPTPVLDSLMPHSRAETAPLRVAIVARTLGTSAMKFAATVFGPFITSVAGLVVPVRSPEKDWNWYPTLAVAFTVAVPPAGYAPPPVTAPAVAGLGLAVSVYCVENVAV